MDLREIAYTLSLFTLFFSSCSKQDEKNDKVIQIDISTSQPLNMADIVKHISIIPLETNDSCLIKRIVSMQVQNGKIFINNDQNEIMVFDGKGKYIHSTRHLLGQGPNDYIGVSSMYIDDNSHIGIYEPFSPRIREYDNFLKLVHSYQMNIPDSTRSAREMRSYAKLTEDIYVINDPKDIYFYSVKQEKILKTIHDEYPDLIGITSHFRLANYNNALFYSYSYPCDTLYKVDKSTLSLHPVAIYDFNEGSVNIKEIPQDMPMDYYMYYLMKTDKIIVLDKFHLHDTDIGYFMKEQNSYFAYKKKNGKVTVYQQEKEYTFPIPSAIEDNKFYYAALPHKVNTFIDKALMDKQDIERIENFKDDDNQVVVCYELK